MQSLAHYKLGDHLADDRVAEVYRATDTALGRTVTVRILRPQIAADAARRHAVVDTALAATRLSHPNIATLFDVGEEDDRHYFVFENTPGESLRAVVAGSPLNLRRAVDFGAQVADALAEAHSQGIVHGALSPDAVVLTQKGRVKVLGFGLPPLPADLDVQAEPSLSTEEVECLAPERVLGARIDARADLFSLGCLMFEMLTGRQPFSAATSSDTVVAVLGRTAPPPSHTNARVPAALDRIVERCLAKSVDRRTDSAAAVAAELREVAAGLDADDQAMEAPMALPSRAARPRRRRWLIVLLILLCLAALGALAALRFLV